MDFQVLARLILTTLPFLSASEVLDLTAALLPNFVAPLDVTDAEALGAYALTLANVQHAAAEGKKIVCIKEIRAASKCGLLEAKNATESKVFKAAYPNVDMYYRPSSF